jgi:hypothetical protein
LCCVGDGDLLLVFAVGNRDGVGDVPVVELCESEEEVEVGFVGVVCLGRGVAVWDEEAAPPG